MSISRSAASVAIARALGLVAGLALTVVVARQFGSTRSTDLIFNALAIPNALMALLSIFLPPCLVSVFKSLEVKRGADEAWAFARSALRVSAVAGLAAATAGALLSPLLARALGSGFTPDEAGLMGRYMAVAFLLLLFSTISSTLKGILTASESYALPALDTFTTNVIGLLVIAAAASRWGTMTIIAGTLIGGAGKILLMTPRYLRTRRTGSAALLHPALKEVARILGPILVRCLILALHVAIVRSLASRIPMEGAVSHLNYAEKIFSAPHEIFTASLGVVLLPLLAEHAARNETEDLVRRIQSGLRVVSFFAIPTAVGLAVLAQPIVRLLCQRGQFDETATAETARALRGFSLALLFSGQFILDQAFYAWKRTWPILLSAAAMAAVNAVLGFLLVGPYRQAGLACSYSAAYGAGFVVVVALFAARAGWRCFGAVLSGTVRVSICAAAMGAILWGLQRRFSLPVAVWILLGAAVYAALARVLCAFEWAQARKLWTRPRGAGSA